MLLRARDVRERCKGRVDPTVMYCLEALAEQQGVLKQQLVEVAETLSSAINAINDLANALGHMKDFVEGGNIKDRLEHMGHDDDEPPVTQ